MTNEEKYRLLIDIKKLHDMLDQDKLPHGDLPTPDWVNSISKIYSDGKININELIYICIMYGEAASDIKFRSRIANLFFEDNIVLVNLEHRI